MFDEIGSYNNIDHLRTVNKIRDIALEVVRNIVDLRLKVLVINSTFITGGCFKSLYNNQEVNDYDFYFTDSESANKFIELIEAGLQKPPSDPFTNQKNFRLDFKHKSQFAMTFLLNGKTKIQFITRYAGTPEEITNRFDFEHCKNYFRLSTDEVVMNEHVLREKKLIFNPKATHPINCLKRMQKFIQQGWTIHDAEIMKIAEAINDLKLKDPKVYIEQCAGMYTFRESKMRGYPSKNVIG